MSGSTQSNEDAKNDAWVRRWVPHKRVVKKNYFVCLDFAGGAGKMMGVFG